VYANDQEYFKTLNGKYHMGGFMGRDMPRESICEIVSYAQSTAKIPLLVAANFEAGGDGFINEGTNVGPNMLVAASGDPSMAGKQAYVCAREGLAAGANYAFALL
jgi:beta-N-acetylhexosaminidase